jgi:hypothetical protein
MFIVPLALLMLLMSTGANAATKYVTTSTTCSDGSTNYIPQSNTCGTGGTATAYRVLAVGMRALRTTSGVGDILLIRGGTYTLSGTYGNNGLDTYGCIPSCPTSWANAVQIKNYPSEIVTITGGGFNMDPGASASNYVIFEGDARSRFVMDGQNVTNANGFRVNGAVHHVRIKTLTVKNYRSHGINGGATCTTPPAFIEILNSEIRHNGDAGDGPIQEHGIYPSCSDDWIVDGNYVVDNYAFGIAFNHTPQRNVTISNNIVEGRQACSACGTAAIELDGGSGFRRIFNNVIIGQGPTGTRHSTGIQLFNEAAQSGAEIYNNTFYNLPYGIWFSGSTATNTIIKNNIFALIVNNILFIETTLGSGTVMASNICPTTFPTCGFASSTSNIVTNTPGFNNAAAFDFSLNSSAAAKDAGTSTVSSVVTRDIVGVVRPQGAGYDVGAYEFPSAADTTPPAAPTGLTVE